LAIQSRFSTLCDNEGQVGMITLEKSGARTVHLFIPFEHNKKRIESITIGPLLFGHALRWGQGAWKDSVEFLVELADVDKSVILSLRYPDADRVMECFMALLTPDIRNDVVEGRIPLKPPEEEVEERPRATNGSGEELGELLGPGVPIPPPLEAGFDLSEEP
jgi:hypothetical protein